MKKKIDQTKEEGTNVRLNDKKGKKIDKRTERREKSTQKKTMISQKVKRMKKRKTE